MSFCTDAESIFRTEKYLPLSQPHVVDEHLADEAREVTDGAHADDVVVDEALNLVVEPVHDGRDVVRAVTELEVQ